MTIVLAEQGFQLRLVIERCDVVVPGQSFAVRLLERAQILQHLLDAHRCLAAFEEERVLDILDHFRFELE